MPTRAIILDRDNTLIENAGYLGDPAGVKLLPGIPQALAALRQLGYLLVVVSNQAGVGRGYYDEAAVKAVNDEMCRQIRTASGAEIDACYYCPFHPEAKIEEYRGEHPWRKPKPGMLLQAAADLGFDLARSWMIGDQYRDVGAGKAAGCRTILLENPDLAPANEPEKKTVQPDFTVRTLSDAVPIVAASQNG